MEARTHGWCARAAPALLAHLSIFLAVYGGAMLATGARLKWDPSTYIALRELLPEVYCACAALMPLAAALLLAHAHLALAAFTARNPQAQRTLWLVYAVCAGGMVAAEVSFGVWAALAVRAWLATDLRQQLQQAAEIQEHLVPLLAALEKWHPLPARVKLIIEEARVDAPWNGYVAAAAALALLVAQLAALALALAARAAVPAAVPARPTMLKLPYSSRGSDGMVPYERRLLHSDSR